MDNTILPNWIADTNRFNLPEPPRTFLQGLYDFDPRLVILPSRMSPPMGASPSYLLAIRRLHSAGLGDTVMLDNKHPDTNMCWQHSLLPIGPLRFKSRMNMFTANCLASLIVTLKARDTWAVTGGPGGDGDKLVDQIEAMEAQDKATQREALKDMFRHRARDAWRSLTARAGWRNKRASDYHGVARPHGGTAVK